MKKLSIIILSYNSKHLILDCLASIPAHSDWEIIIPDNGSTDGSKEAILKQFPKIKFIENDKNLGFAAGNNVGIKKSQGEYVLLLNPDTVVKTKTIETVLDYMENNPKVGAATCRLEFPSGKLDYSCHRNFPDPVNSFLHFIGLKKISAYTNINIPNTIHEIDSLTGAFALIRRTAGNQVNWLDEDYYWNAEDIDFCYKLKEKGWKVMYIPQVKIIHYKGYASQATPESKKRWAVHSTDAMKLFYQKHLAKKYSFFINRIVYLGITTLKFARLLKSYF